MLLGAVVGLLTVAAWGALGVGVLASVMGDQSTIGWGILGLAMLGGSPLILCLSRSRLSRAVGAAVLAIIAALAATAFWSIAFSLFEQVIRSAGVARTPTLAAVYVAVLISTTELVCQWPSKDGVTRVVRATALALLIVFVGELFRNALHVAVATGTIIESERITWSVIAAYAFLVGANVIYFQDTPFGKKDEGTRRATFAFLVLNFVVLTGVVATGFIQPSG